MGLNPFRGCGNNDFASLQSINPDPNRFKILQSCQYNDLVILKVKYFGCTNFDGVKVLVFKAKDFMQLDSGKLDPHFCQGLSPMARFRPDDEGISMAISFCIHYEEHELKEFTLLHHTKED